MSELKRFVCCIDLRGDCYCPVDARDKNGYCTHPRYCSAKQSLEFLRPETDPDKINEYRARNGQSKINLNETIENLEVKQNVKDPTKTENRNKTVMQKTLC